MGTATAFVLTFGGAIGITIVLHLIFRFLFAPRNNVFFYMFWGSFLLQIVPSVLLYIMILDSHSSNDMAGAAISLGWLGLLYGLYYYHFKVKKLYKKE